MVKNRAKKRMDFSKVKKVEDYFRQFFLKKALGL